ncbi:MAG: DUF6364 family protein [Lautropia sp.]|nr:DUF6364 family protein [Lautropia sp.]
MQTKLTLRMDAELIALAKAQAKRNGKSLSEFVADYFAQFVSPPAAQPLPPIVSSMVGILKTDQTAMPDEAVYRQYLQEKYL